jgi:putative membrane protein
MQMAAEPGTTQGEGREVMSNDTGKRTPDPKPTSSTAPAEAGGRRGIHEILAGFAASLGMARIGSPKPADGTLDTSTKLAMDRTYWAAERTLMGWIRTALSMISFGFTIGKVGQTLQNVDVKGLRGMREIGVNSIAYLLVTLGTVSLLAAAVQYSRRVYELQVHGQRVRPSIGFVVALVLSVMGIFAFTSLVSEL